jgi:acyl-coenzyme A thioesterase PaaI-like protein
VSAARQRARPPARPENHSASQAQLEAIRAAEHRECFLCGAANPLGLGLTFEVQEGGSVLARVPCPDNLRSYRETLHGGVVAAVLDGAMTNALFAAGVVAVTAELTVRFVAPVVNGRDAAVRAWIDRATSHRLFYLRSELEQGGQVVARASARFIERGPARPVDSIRPFGRRGRPSGRE